MMDPRDELRAKHGLLPIFVDPPRPLTQDEIEETLSALARRRGRWHRSWLLTLTKYEPVVGNGQLFWRPRP